MCIRDRAWARRPCHGSKSGVHSFGARDVRLIGVGVDEVVSGAAVNLIGRSILNVERIVTRAAGNLVVAFLGIDLVVVGGADHRVIARAGENNDPVVIPGAVDVVVSIAAADFGVDAGAGDGHAIVAFF